MPSKQCSKCGQIKSLDMFRKKSSHSDGFAPECKECARALDREYRAHPEIRERRRQAASEYGQRPKTETVKPKPQPEGKKSTRWYQKTPGALKAHHAIHAAVKAGYIPHPSSLKCDTCPKQAAEYHHYLGYSPRHWLDVIPLCRTCHKRMHR